MAYKPNFQSQRDPRWQATKLGFDTRLTIGSDGCALTCLAMLATGFGHPETPDTLNKKLIKLGPGKGYIGPLMVWAGLTRLYPRIGIKELYVCSHTKPVPFKRIDSLLSNGQAVLVEIDSSLALGEQSHWVLLIKKLAEDYLMLDPWALKGDGNGVPILEKYGFGRTLEQVITAVAFYECWETINNLPLTTGIPGLYIRVLKSVTSGLLLRVQPNATASKITAEIASAPLLVLDDKNETLSNIGVTDRWIKVRDPQGFEGYVAAWYVEMFEEILPPVEPQPQPIPETPLVVPPPVLVEPQPQGDQPPETKPEPEPQPEPQPGPLTVYVSAGVGDSGLRLRSQPNLTSSVVAILKASEPLLVLEDGTSAKSKVGVSNQWLNVRNGSGLTGYCAAWFVVLPDVSQPVDTPVTIPVPVVTPPVTQTPPADKLSITVSQSVGKAGLRLRSAPVDGPVLLILPAGALLSVEEDPVSARSKIGAPDQWLQVKDDLGHEGYVAAWYVHQSQEPVNGGTPEKTALFTVTVSSVVGNGGLRLRSAPNTSGKVLQVLAGKTNLQVLEASDSARKKIGIINQWLNVRSPSGQAGYVAAWYVLE